jgi:hypothetical protein
LLFKRTVLEKMPPENVNDHAREGARTSGDTRSTSWSFRGGTKHSPSLPA